MESEEELLMLGLICSSSFEQHPIPVPCIPSLHCDWCSTRREEMKERLVLYLCVNLKALQSKGKASGWLDGWIII